ncbi:MAG: ATP-dependent helicase [Actinomycetota bacterium]|nr:ATP-dependent helicase [Actinomycetota bacterium]
MRSATADVRASLRPPAYRLVRRSSATRGLPDLDDAQRAVVEHAGGPLLVLAGPGTGKTTTLVEAAVARIQAGVDPERVLVLTFSRKAATELRERITVRLGRTLREPLARTFHSYAFGLVRRDAAARGDAPPRLLSGPEQDLLVRELLSGEVAGDGVASGWPPDLRPALLTRGFAQELRDLLMRATERGIDPAALDRLGRAHGRPDWRAAARFLRQYAEVSLLADQAAYDPSELVRAVLDRGLVEQDRGAYDWVFVDEYQDTDPSQEELLCRLVPRGANVVAVGDPDQSIYAFRGADVRCIRRFPETFRCADGSPSPQVRLLTCRRSAPRVLTAGQAVAAPLRGPRGPRQSTGQHAGGLHPLPGRAPGAVDVLVTASAAQEASVVAAVLRRAHVVDGIPWGRMAVLVRSTRGRLPVLRRAMVSAGVPVGVASGDLPLAEQPAVRPFLDLLRAALCDDGLDEERAASLLTFFAGLDAMGLRRLRRELRHVSLAAGEDRFSGDLLVEALRTPLSLTLVADRVAAPARRVAELVALAREAASRPGATVETVLWALWQASDLATRWQSASAAGGARGAAADRDLDAVLALFEAAARFVDRLPGARPEALLDHLAAQEIPGDTLAARAPDGDTVRVFTAHGAKGLEWDLVVVAGAQEGVWPSLRPRGSVLGADLLMDIAAGLEAPPTSSVSAQLDEERRLFYVACTRARDRLVVTAVDDGDEGTKPSRFLDELPLADDDEAPVEAVVDRTPGDRRYGACAPTLGHLRRTLPLALLVPRLRQVIADRDAPSGTRSRARDLVRDLAAVSRPLALSSVVAELRAVVSDDTAGDGLRRAAAAELARLAAAGVVGAHPQDWYSLGPVSDDRPLRGPGDVVAVSPSRVELFGTCPLRWLLESAGGRDADTARQTVGTLVHDLAARAAAADVGTSRELDRLVAELDTAWADVDLGSPWFTRQQRDVAERMLRRFAAWAAANPRTPVAAEVPFDVSLDAGALTARVTGRVDRLERDGEGRAFVVDLKTGSSKPSDDEVASHPQLGVYQLAAEHGAFAGHGLHGCAGASLVQLGKAAGTTAQPKEQVQLPLQTAPDPGWAASLVATVAQGMAGSVFPARENRYCERCPVRSSCPLHDDGRQVGTR